MPQSSQLCPSFRGAPTKPIWTQLLKIEWDSLLQKEHQCRQPCRCEGFCQNFTKVWTSHQASYSAPGSGGTHKLRSISQTSSRWVSRKLCKHLVSWTIRTIYVWWCDKTKREIMPQYETQCLDESKYNMLEGIHEVKQDGLQVKFVFITLDNESRRGARTSISRTDWAHSEFVSW